jgi:arylsulfatase A-like enzyme
MSDASSRPNVVVLITHDTGKFLSTYGHKTVNTPSFERLAAESATFDACFCTTPLCAPSRAALLTGLHHHQNGMMGLPGDHLGGWDLVTKDRHLASVFVNNGYSTVLCGFEHETHDFFSVGFQQAIHGSGTGNNGGQPLAGAHEDIALWLDERYGDRVPGGGDADPFYMQIGCSDTHREWSRYAPSYSEKGIWKAPYLIDDPAVDREMAEQQGACNTLDDGVGRILEVFDRRGLSENTIFVITTDHGIDFPRAKGTLFDPGVEVFLFMRYRAGGWREGVRIGELVSQVDIYPTVLQACGIPIPDGTAGMSFLPLLTGSGDYRGRDAVFLEKTYHDNYDPMRALRTDRYKYVLNMDAQTLYDVRIATAPRYNWFRFPFKKRSREELYDLEQDPHEATNLADDPNYDEVRRKLKARLARWMAETEDPLLEGSIPSPYHLRVSAEMKALASEP